MKGNPGLFEILYQRMARIGEEEDADGGRGEEPVSKGHPKVGRMSSNTSKKKTYYLEGIRR